MDHRAFVSLCLCVCQPLVLGCWWLEVIPPDWKLALEVCQVCKLGAGGVLCGCHTILHLTGWLLE